GMILKVQKCHRREAGAFPMQASTPLASLPSDRESTAGDTDVLSGHDRVAVLVEHRQTVFVELELVVDGVRAEERLEGRHGRLVAVRVGQRAHEGEAVNRSPRGVRNVERSLRGDVGHEQAGLVAEVHLVRPNEGRAGDDVETTDTAGGGVAVAWRRAAAGGIGEGIRAEEPLLGVRSDDPEATSLGHTGTLELEVSRNGHVERVVAGGGVEVGELEVSGTECLHDLVVDLDAHGLDLGDHDLTAELADVHRRLFVGDRDSLDQVLVELDRRGGLTDLLELDRVQTGTPFVLTSDGEPTGVERQSVIEG